MVLHDFHLELCSKLWIMKISPREVDRVVVAVYNMSINRTIQYGMIFNVRSKADISQLNLHRNTRLNYTQSN